MQKHGMGSLYDSTAASISCSLPISGMALDLRVCQGRCLCYARSCCLHSESSKLVHAACACHGLEEDENVALTVHKVSRQVERDENSLC